MKYSNYIGISACVAIIIVCFLPWAFIPSLNTTLTGFNTAGTNFGKPGLLMTIVSVLAIFLFIIPAISAKRINVFVGAFNLAWSVRNFILFSQCELGECPEKKIGLYLSVIFSAILLLMTFLPKVREKN